jgi:hypothetical protein
MRTLEWLSFIIGLLFFGGCGILAAMTVVGYAANTINA